MIAFFLALLGPLLCDQVTIDPEARVWTCLIGTGEVGIVEYAAPPAMKPVVYIVDEAEWTSLPDLVGRDGFER